MNFKYKIGTLLYLYKCTYFVSVWPSFSQWANLVQNRYTYFVPILYPEIVPILYFILVWAIIKKMSHLMGKRVFRDFRPGLTPLACAATEDSQKLEILYFKRDFYVNVAKQML